MKCNSPIFIYQKDGPGWLKRCYLNRIIESENYPHLINNIKDISNLHNLKCKCGNIIGYPIRHKDGRLAFSLIRGKFKRSPYKVKK